jgi:AraC family transcriptional regulator
LEINEKKDAVRRMQDHIEQHIQESITLYEIAQSAGYSPTHSARIFKDITGVTLFEYIRTLRLSQAAVKLETTDSRVMDVALDFVFDSHEGFTRAFSKQFGVNPQTYRNSPTPIRLFTLNHSYNIKPEYQNGENKMATNANLQTVFVQVIDRPKRKLILKRGKKATNIDEYFDEIGREEGYLIWGNLAGIKEALYEPIGITRMPKHLQPPETSTYSQGVEVPADYQGEVPTGFEIVDLPPCKIMVFQGPPYDEIYVFHRPMAELHRVMDNFDPELYGYTWADEDGPGFYLLPLSYRGFIEARPVKPHKAKRSRPETIENRWDILYRDYPEVYEEWTKVKKDGGGNLKYLGLEGKIVVDIGSGTGKSSFDMAPLAKQVIGIEPEESMMKIAEENLKLKGFKNVIFKKGSQDNIPLPDHSVDMVACLTGGNLSEVVYIERFVKEAERVLVKGGSIVEVDLPPGWYGGELNDVIMAGRPIFSEFAKKMENIMNGTFAALGFEYEDYEVTHIYDSLEHVLSTYGFIFGKRAIEYIKAHNKTSIKFKYRIRRKKV